MPLSNTRKALENNASESKLDEALLKDLDAQTIRRLGYEFSDKKILINTFDSWYRSVWRHMEIPKEPVWEMFIGKISDDEFLKKIGPDAAKRVYVDFEALHATWLKS